MPPRNKTHNLKPDKIKAQRLAPKTQPVNKTQFATIGYLQPPEPTHELELVVPDRPLQTPEQLQTVDVRPHVRHNAAAQTRAATQTREANLAAAQDRQHLVANLANSKI